MNVNDMQAGTIVKLVQKTLEQVSALLSALDHAEFREIKGAVPGKCLQIEKSLAKVTSKERELLEFIHNEPGLSVKQLATALKKSEGSVKAQLSSLYRKFDVNTRAGLVSKTQPFFPKA